MANEKTWIYALVDPRDQQVKYIGQSVSPASRLLMARTMQGSPSEQFWNWTQELKAEGLKSSMVLLQETTQEYAGTAEYYWMRVFKDVGAKLLNKQFYEAHDYRNRKRWVERLNEVS